MPQGDVSYVTAELPTLVAFAKMIKQERSSVAVVNSDEAHILVGNLSISDIREVTPGVVIGNADKSTSNVPDMARCCFVPTKLWNTVYASVP